MVLLGSVLTTRIPTNHICCPTSTHLQILIFNHSSYLDGVVLMHLFAPSGVSKASNAHLPLVGRVIRSFQNIYVPENPPAAGQNGNGGGAAAGEWDGKPRMNLSALITQR